MWAILLSVITFFLFFLYFITTQKFSYWKKKKVPHLQPVPLLGNYGDFVLLKTFVGNVARNICRQFPNEPYIGAYFGTEPTLIVQDPELLKLILTKDFYYFNGREASNYAEKEAVTKGMFFNHGDHWKLVRQTLTPLFSVAKMKNMFPLIEKCTADLEKLLEHEIQYTNVFEMNTLMSRFTMDCVGSCAFGIEFNVLQKDYENNPYRKIGELVLGKSDFRGYSNIARSIWPRIFYALGLKIFPLQVTDSMVTLITNVCNLRNNKPSARNDFVDLLLSLKANEYLVGDSLKKSITGESTKVYKKLDDELMSGMCLAFFGGGFETSSTTLVLTLFEIAKNKEVQLKVHQEIDDYLGKRNNKLDYDCVTELPYLTACMDETLRLYPLFSVITREVMEDYILPTGLKLDKGVRIHVPVYHIHRNPDNFPDPDQFRPERFMPDEKHNIKPYTYFPFGEGPRLCIVSGFVDSADGWGISGFDADFWYVSGPTGLFMDKGARFSRMEAIPGLITVLKNYKVKLAEGMSKTVDFDPRLLVLHTVDDLLLEFQRRPK